MLLTFKQTIQKASKINLNIVPQGSAYHSIICHNTEVREDIHTWKSNSLTVRLMMF